MIETWLACIIIIEVLLTLFCVWGILHEDTLVRFEHRTYRKIRKSIRNLYRFLRAVRRRRLFNKAKRCRRKSRSLTLTASALERRLGCSDRYQRTDRTA